MRKILTVLLCAAALCSAQALRRAPGFSLPDSKGQQFDLADFRGRVVLLDFMQTSCPHCAPFSAVLAQAQQKYGDRLAVLAVVNPPDDAARVNSFIGSHKVNYPMLFDCGQAAYSYVRSGTFDIPHVYLIDANGNIQDEFAYSEANKNIFEGNGLFQRLEAVMGGAAKKK